MGTYGVVDSFLGATVLFAYIQWRLPNLGWQKFLFCGLVMLASLVIYSIQG